MCITLLAIMHDFFLNLACDLCWIEDELKCLLQTSQPWLIDITTGTSVDQETVYM